MASAGLYCLKSPREALQAVGSVLSENPPSSVEGHRGQAQHTLDFTGPTTVPSVSANVAVGLRADVDCQRGLGPTSQ